MIEITLEPYELGTAALVGLRRQLASMNRTHRGGLVGNAWQQGIEGACGEMAVAKALGLYWAGGINTFNDRGDVGPYDVCTRSKGWHDLIVRPHVADERIYILATGSAPRFCVVGWCWTQDAKRPEWLQEHGDRPGAYFVPQAELHPLETLPRNER